MSVCGWFVVLWVERICAVETRCGLTLKGRVLVVASSFFFFCFKIVHLCFSARTSMGKPILTCAVVSDVTFGYVILIKCFWDLIILKRCLYNTRCSGFVEICPFHHLAHNIEWISCEFVYV